MYRGPSEDIYLDSLAQLRVVEAVDHGVGHRVGHSEGEERLPHHRVHQLEGLLVNEVPAEAQATVKRHVMFEVNKTAARPRNTTKAGCRFFCEGVM